MKFEKFVLYPHLGIVLPALGYSAEQLAALQQTINAAPVDMVIASTPIDLGALLALNKPVVRARYEFEEMDTPGLAGIVADFLVR